MINLHKRGSLRDQTHNPMIINQWLPFALPGIDLRIILKCTAKMDFSNTHRSSFHIWPDMHIIYRVHCTVCDVCNI